MRTVHTLFVLLIIQAVAFPATIYVPDDYATIQGAINAAGNGDTIIVRPGTYVENIDFIGKAITVQSEQGSAATTIDGSQAGSVVTFKCYEGPESRLIGFLIVNGNAGSGGGILMYDQCSPTIEDNVITSNRASWSGGGIYCFFDSDPLILNNQLTHNDAGDSGGAICAVQASPTVRHNYIACNTAALRGGGVCGLEEPGIELVGNTVAYNTADCGAGVYLAECDSDWYPVIYGNLFVENHASSKGGAIMCSDFFHAPATLIGNTIAANAAGASGGGLYCEDAYPLYIANSIFSANDAVEGPAIWLGEGPFQEWSDLTIAYSDLDGGQASVYIEAASTFSIGPGMINGKRSAIHSPRDCGDGKGFAKWAHIGSGGSGGLTDGLPSAWGQFPDA